MNLLELSTKVCQQLGENPAAPQFWTSDEIIDNLNEAYREILRRTSINDLMIPMLEAEPGAFYFPHDLMKWKAAYWKGRPIGHKSIDFLEARYSGTSHDNGLVGTGRVFEGNFRSAIGDPSCWYMEDGKLKLFPRPESSYTSSAIRETTYGTLSAGSLTLTLAVDIPTDQSRVTVWIDGVYQFSNQWSIVNSKRIDFVGSALGVDVGVAVRFIPDSISSALLATAKKFLVCMSAGATRVIVPGGYVRGVGALTVSLDGIEQDPSTYLESSTSYATLTSSVVLDSVIEISVTHPNPFGVVSALYSARPQSMALDADQPNIPEDLHRGIWQYACFLCMTRDGRGQDMKKSEVMMGLFDKTLSDMENLFRPEITFDPAVSMPFRM